MAGFGLAISLITCMVVKSRGGGAGFGVGKEGGEGEVTVCDSIRALGVLDTGDEGGEG